MECPIKDKVSIVLWLAQWVRMSSVKTYKDMRPRRERQCKGKATAKEVETETERDQNAYVPRDIVSQPPA